MTYSERDKKLGLGENLAADERALRLVRVQKAIEAVMKIAGTERVVLNCWIRTEGEKAVIRYVSLEGQYSGMSMPNALLPDDWEAAVTWVMDGLDDNTAIQLTGKASPEQVIEAIEQMK